MGMFPRAGSLFGLVLLAAACGGGAPAATAAAGDVTVQVKEYSVSLSKTPSAGSVKLVVRNTGSIVHDLQILKTDLAPDKLPVDNAKAKEDGKVSGTPGINPGESTTLTVELQPGNYVFICNQPGHYSLGTRLQVVVK